ncbi:hypothetical protein N7493_002528 [Penicillium malachiteum]|uniref:Uncharacterized protein n=1 Tax=Penicillium malachiteum TaxID=1324776 RepID=A0AAD6HSQ5_9EURO|nr:hypothetical protein N7493_002528 [Penicillium malachiteum]
MRTTAMSDDLQERVLQAARENRMPGATMCANLLNPDTTEATFAALKNVWRQWRKGQRWRGLQREGYDPKMYKDIAGTAPYKSMRLMWILNIQDRHTILHETLASSRVGDPTGTAPDPAAPIVRTARAARAAEPEPEPTHAVSDGPPPGYDTTGIAYDPAFPIDPAMMLDPGTATTSIGMRTSAFSYESDDLVWNAPLMVVMADAYDPKDIIQYRFQSCNLSELMAEDRPNWPDYRKADFVSFDDMWLNWKGLEITTLSNHLLQMGHMTEQGSLWWSFRPATQWRAMLYNETNRLQITNADVFRDIVRRTYEEHFPWYHGKRERGRGGVPNGPRPCFTIFVVPNSQGKSIH